jgi:hypothetical protein
MATRRAAIHFADDAEIPPVQTDSLKHRTIVVSLILFCGLRALQGKENNKGRPTSRLLVYNLAHAVHICSISPTRGPPSSSSDVYTVCILASRHLYESRKTRARTPAVTSLLASNYVVDNAPPPLPDARDDDRWSLGAYKIFR